MLLSFSCRRDDITWSLQIPEPEQVYAMNDILTGLLAHSVGR